MTYAVKECFLTLQGEGVLSGSRAVFLRFAGCNLWSGREEDRASAICRFCDTDFVGTDGEGGGKFTSAEALAARVEVAVGRGERAAPGGYHRGRADASAGRGLVDALHARGFRIAVETNGTLAATPGIDWICVSPKAGTEVVQRRGDELKLVWPQEGIDPAELEGWEFDHFLVQPMDCDGAKRRSRRRSRWRWTGRNGVCRCRPTRLWDWPSGLFGRRWRRRGPAASAAACRAPSPRCRACWPTRCALLFPDVRSARCNYVGGHVRRVAGDGVDRGDVVRDDILGGQILVDVQRCCRADRYCRRRRGSAPRRRRMNARMAKLQNAEPKKRLPAITGSLLKCQRLRKEASNYIALLVVVVRRVRSSSSSRSCRPFSVHVRRVHVRGSVHVGGVHVSRREVLIDVHSVVGVFLAAASRQPPGPHQRPG